MESYIKELENRVKELEQELEQVKKAYQDANRSKTMFLANMSHEIRTPMNSILGIYSILNQTTLSDEQREFLEIINIASHNLLIIINDILDLSKIETGQLKIESKPFSIHEEISQVIKLLSLKAKGKGIELHSKIQSTVPKCVIGDAVRLKQILINLTNNALKFTHEGYVHLSVETLNPTENNLDSISEFIPNHLLTKPFDETKLMVRFAVSDTGIGISEEEQQTIFHDFAQLENPLVQQFEGTGLGLSISKNLTALMNGKIGVISQKHKGSTFWFTLVFEQADESLLYPPAETTSVPSLTKRPLNILLVEDNLLNQKFAVTSLRREQHLVDIAENGKVALEKFKTKSYDLILMDIAMPIMNGLEAARMIRELEAEKKRSFSPEDQLTFQPVKIVAITAYVMVTDKEKCIQAGMNDYLVKPYRPNDLIRMIESLNIY